MGMNEAVERDMRKSMAYVDAIQPVVQKLLGGEFMPVEGEENPVCQMLDRTCGTDYFQVYRQRRLVWGVASRVQEIWDGCKPFNTFTVRKSRASGVKTEYEKRKDAIRSGGVYPYLTLQAYVNDKTGALMSLAVVRTEDLMKYVESGKAKEKHTGEKQIGQAAFFTVDWQGFHDAGYRILAYPDNSIIRTQTA